VLFCIGVLPKAFAKLQQIFELPKFIFKLTSFNFRAASLPLQCRCFSFADAKVVPFLELHKYFGKKLC